MKKAKIEVQHFNDVNCFWSGLSILRLALGYSGGMPLGIKRKKDPKVPVDWIVKNAGRIFPEHEVYTWGYSIKGAYHPLELEPFFRTTGDFVWMFGFSTFEHIARNALTSGSVLVENHTVVGLPVFYEGMFPVYAIKVNVAGKQKAKKKGK